MGGASLRTQGEQRSKDFVVVLKTHMTKLEILVSCTTPTFPRIMPPNRNFKADNISFRQNHHFRVGNLPQTQIPNFEVGSIRLSVRTRLLRLAVLQKLRFQCFVFESPNFNDGNMSCLFKTHFSKFNLFVAGARPKFQS